jgi:hypothetical protein
VAVLAILALPGAAGARKPLTNLAHLDFLGDTAAPPAQAGHTTYRLSQRPRLRALWTYAEPAGGAGRYKRLGGGDLDAATRRWSQGAYNTDDMARAAVVYLRHWRLTGALRSRHAAFGLLRTVAYMQTLRPGPRRGNFVFWMQPDGELNPSAEPKEEPDPSDSADSYWLARSIWALGEGHAAFRRADPAFARFLRARLRLAIEAAERGALRRYGRLRTVDGLRLPAWLIADGADASA